MKEIKESFLKAYDKIMSKIGVEDFCIQWNHAYTSNYERHFHFVLSQNKLPISHAKLGIMPFPLRKIIIINPKYYSPKLSEEEKEYLNKNYTKFLVP